MATGMGILNIAQQMLWFAVVQEYLIFSVMLYCCHLPGSRFWFALKLLGGIGQAEMNHCHPWKSRNLWILQWTPASLTCKVEHRRTEKQGPCLPNKAIFVACMYPLRRKIMEMWGMHVHESTMFMDIYKIKYLLMEIGCNMYIIICGHLG